MPNVHEVKIVILETPKCDLDQYRNDMGELAICVPRSVQFSIVKKRDETTDLDKMTSDYSTSFDLPIDNKTRIILGNVQYQVKKGVSIFRAILCVGDMVIIDGFLNINASVERLTSNIVSYTVQIIGTHQTWKEYFRTHCLQDLDLGSFTWGKTQLANLMQNNQVYTNGGDAIYPMLADFGKFYKENHYTSNKNDVLIYDFRFVVYKAAILRAAFANAGYCIDSIHINSENFRRQSLYCFKQDFYKNGTEEGLEHLRLNAEIEVGADTPLSDTLGGVPPYPALPTDIIPFDTEIIDLSNYWNNVSTRYQNTSIRKINGLFMRVNLDVCDVGSTSPFGAFVFEVYVNIFNGVGGHVFSQSISGGIIAVYPNTCVNFNTLVNLDQMFRDNLASFGTLDPNWYVELTMTWFPNTTEVPIVKAGSSVEFFFGGSHFYEDETLDIAKILSCDFTLFDLLLDFRKEYGWEFETDESRKTVTIEPNPNKYIDYQTYTLPERAVKGFETGIDNVFDITDAVDICQEVVKEFEPQENYNQIRFKFKDSSDESPLYEPYKVEGNELWSKTVQIGNANAINELVVELQIIEPTINNYVSRISLEPNLPYRAIYLPIMWENAPDTNSPIPTTGINYEPRSFVVFGLVEQRGIDVSGNSVTRRWTFEGTTYVEVPTLAQALPPDLAIVPFFTPLFPIINNIFGDNVFNVYVKDLVSTYYPNAAIDLQEAITLELKILLSTLDFKCFDIRQIARIFSEKMPLIHLNNHYKISRISKPFNSSEHAIISLTPKLPCE